MKCHLCKDNPCRNGQPCVEKDSAPLYKDPMDLRLLKTAAEIEADYYGEICRVDEIMEFSRRMGFKKLGIAFCVGLAKEARVIGEIFSREFEVHSVCCKVGGMLKKDFGMPTPPWLGSTTCNPAEQANILNEEGTDFNIVVGLCVGHDSIFYKYSQAPVTTLITKDRKLGHNPAAAIYCPYITRTLGGNLKKRTE